MRTSRWCSTSGSRCRRPIPEAETLARVEALMGHPAFSLEQSEPGPRARRQPSRMVNQTQFNRADGAGYASSPISSCESTRRIRSRGAARDRVRLLADDGTASAAATPKRRCARSPKSPACRATLATSFSARSLEAVQDSVLASAIALGGKFAKLRTDRNLKR